MTARCSAGDAASTSTAESSNGRTDRTMASAPACRYRFSTVPTLLRACGLTRSQLRSRQRGPRGGRARLPGPLFDGALRAILARWLQRVRAVRGASIAEPARVVLGVRWGDPEWVDQESAALHPGPTRVRAQPSLVRAAAVLFATAAILTAVVVMLFDWSLAEVVIGGLVGTLS